MGQPYVRSRLGDLTKNWLLGTLDITLNVSSDVFQPDSQIPVLTFSNYNIHLGTVLWI